jgi:hypothetical protein
MKAGGFALRVHVGGGRRSERQQGQLWANAMNSLLQNKNQKCTLMNRTENVRNNNESILYANQHRLRMGNRKSERMGMM